MWILFIILSLLPLFKIQEGNTICLNSEDQSTKKIQNELPLSPKEERDIAKDLEKMLGSLESNEALAFDGEPLDDETKELIRISLENSMRLAKQLVKKKFTPEKYK